MSLATEAAVPRVERFVHDLVVALINLEMHGLESRRPLDHFETLVARLAVDFADGLVAPLWLCIGTEQISHDGAPLVGASLQAAKLLRLCRLNGVAEIGFGLRLEAAELHRLFMLLLDDKCRDVFTHERLPAVLAAHGIRNVIVHLERAEPAAPTGRPRSAVGRYQALADCLQSHHVAAFRGDDLAIDCAAGAVEQALFQMGQEPSSLLALATYDDIDSFTVGHSVRVALLALQVAQAAGIEREDLLRLGIAALLHDIGKSRIPQEVLCKRGLLDADEREVMAEHPRLGAEILLEQKQLDPSAIGAAFCHHMGPFSHGYPTPVLPFEPSGVSKLVRVCDVFEALTSVRPYKKALTPLEAYTVMLREPHGFDARWLRFFVQALGIYPQGTRVLLDSGEEALVIGRGPSPCQPRVQLLVGPQGRPLPVGAPTEVTVGVPHDGMVRTIRTVYGADGHTEDVPPPVLVDPCTPAG